MRRLLILKLCIVPLAPPEVLMITHMYTCPRMLILIITMHVAGLLTPVIIHGITPQLYGSPCHRSCVRYHLCKPPPAKPAMRIT